MASPSIKRGKDPVTDPSAAPLSLEAMSLLTRRFAAWTVEVSLVAVSALVPYGIGAYLETHSQAERVPLNPPLASVEEAIAQTLALPRQQEQHQVPPLTNVCWWLALATPVALSAWQLHLFAKTGRTTPKYWLGIRVVNASGRSPGLGPVILREGAGKWGLPLGTAYLLWRYSWAFPNLGLLVGLAAGMAIAGGGWLFFNPRRRAFHDCLAATVVVDGRRSVAAAAQRKRSQRVCVPSQAVSVEVAPYPASTSGYLLPARVNPVVLASSAQEQGFNLWLWMRRHPGTTLLIFALAGMTGVMGTFVATQIYIQSQADRRQFQQENNAAFLALVNQLGASATDPTEQRQSVILALARLDDPRAVALLVDLLGQESNPALIDTLQQAIASTGIRSLPALRKLNQALSNQLRAGSQQPLIALRLGASKQAIAKQLTLYSGQLGHSRLERVDLSRVEAGEGKFSLFLDRTDLSGIHFQGAQLNRASFQNTIFSGAGQDKHIGTFDDLSADLSQADLSGSDLTAAQLSRVALKRANLLQATLDRANLSQAQLSHANLSSAQLIEANLRAANLAGASLTGANLGSANLTDADLKGANLGRIQALGADFTEATLSNSNGQGADLSAANFRGANLQQANLTSSQLKGANLQNAQLQDANLAYVNLTQADLRGANLAGANFQGAIFASQSAPNSDQFLKVLPLSESSAKIQGVDFTHVKNLSPSQLEFICQNGGISPQCQ
jgi:uncharacterized protein YjbI with pentapeptide repeats/uncharacterized RDD family membrane protein YckC